MRQPTLPNRKPPEFLRCPICGAEFLRRAQRQQWCSSDCAQRAKQQRRRDDAAVQTRNRGEGARRRQGAATVDRFSLAQAIGRLRSSMAGAQNRLLVRLAGWVVVSGLWWPH
jgi:hypothetical protein